MKTIDIGFKNEYYKDPLEECKDLFNTDENIYFRKDINGGRNGCTYYEFKKDTFLFDFDKPNFNYKYEFIYKYGNRKIYMDLDKIELSYTEIIELVETFIKFLKFVYNYEKHISYRVHSSFDNVNEIPNKFKSSHIIFNVCVKTNSHLKQLFLDFKNQNVTNSEFIDLSVYNKNKCFRAILQSKGQTSKGFRNDKLYPIGYTFGKNFNEKKLSVLKYSIDDFVTLTDTYTPLLDFEVRENLQIKTVKTQSYFNFKYRIDETKKAFKLLNELDEKDFLDSKKWKYHLTTIESVLCLKGLNTNEAIFEEPLMIEFLKRSRVKQYDNDKTEKQNKEFILNFLNNTKNHIVNLNSHFFHILQNAEIQFIFNNFEYDENEFYTFDVKKYNNKFYIHILDCNFNDIMLYDVNNKNILLDFSIHSKKGNKEIKYTIKSNCQINYFIERIKITKPNLPNQTIEITDYSQVETNSNQSFYIHGAVGSRKSSLRMRTDVIDILKNPNNRILFINDSVVMTNKTQTDMINLFNDIGLDNTLIKHYHEKLITLAEQKKKEIELGDKFKEWLQNNAHRIKKSKKSKLNDYEDDVNEETEDKKDFLVYITCYDSIKSFCKDIKFTHIIIDEYKNVTKRFLNVSKNKQETLSYFYDLLNKCKCVKLYDADCDEYIIDNFHKYINKKLKIYSLINYKQYNNTIILKNEQETINEIITHLNNGKKITISCAWREYSHQLRDILQKKTDKRIALLDKDGGGDTTNKSHTKAYKNNLIIDTAMWLNNDCIIYTPTITTGISFDIYEGFYKHFHFVGDGGSDETQQAQMIFRVRKLESKEICLTCIKNNFHTLKSNKTIKDDSSNLHFNFNLLNSKNRFNDKISYINSNNIITEELQTIPEGEISIKSSNNHYEDWVKITNLLEKHTEEKLLNNLLKKCYSWGVENIIYKVYPNNDNINNDEETDELNLFELFEETCTNYTNKKWLDASYIDLKTLETDQIKNRINDDSLLFWNIEKTLSLSKFGFSYSIYTTFKKYIDEWFLSGGDKTYNLYLKSKNINFYFEYKNIIYDLYNKSFINSSYDEIIKSCNSVKDPFFNINWIFGLNLSFKIFDLINIQNAELYEIYGGVKMYNINKLEFYDKIKAIIKTNEINNMFNAIKSFKINRITGYDDEYKNIGLILSYAFKQIGLKVIMNKQTEQNKTKNQFINICVLEYDAKDKSVGSVFRIQRTRDYTSNLNSNDYDDETNFKENELQKHYGIVKVIYPKIRLASYKEYDKIINYINLYVEEKNRPSMICKVNDINNIIMKPKKSLEVKEIDDIEHDEDNEDNEECDDNFVY